MIPYLFPTLKITTVKAVLSSHLYKIDKRELDLEASGLAKYSMFFALPAYFLKLLVTYFNHFEAEN